jgi:hypothetical protein
VKYARTLLTAFFKAALKKYGLALLLSLLLQQLYAQNLSNIRHKVFYAKSDTIFVDSLTLVPGTITVRNAGSKALVDSNSYILKPYESRLIWKTPPASDSVIINYRVYPFALVGEAYHKSYAAYLKASANSIAHPFTYNPDETGSKLIDFGSLDYNGSFSRSVSFGSNQDVVLNSAFNLQLSGMLSKDVEITAAITDNNVPIQPEGNTTQLQEFDKIFIQIRKDQHKVIIGDFDLVNPDDYFMKFVRKYEGGYYSGAYKIKGLGILKTAVAGGIARGKYASNTLSVTEGNQGPYPLQGANGETVITILANSEQVYINGEKMERGADRDYTIDYNLGQITFTPKRIITPDLRIIVEFQYSNNDYNRTAVFLSTELQTQKVNVHFNMFSEQDSKNQNIQQSLTPGQTSFLAGLGDSIQKAYYPGYDTTTYDPSKILYELDDTIIWPFPAFDSIFKYSTNPQKAKYLVSFSYVGQGSGNYEPITSSANGTVYQWVVPYWDTASRSFKPQGSYSPVTLLVTPKYQQMYTLGADYKINKTNTLSAAVALSNSDQNMFSSINNNTNAGAAMHLAYKGYLVTAADSANKKNQSFTYDVAYDFLQKTFTQIEPFRNIEFNRDWNLGNQTQSFNQSLVNANAGYVWGGLGSITYNFKALIEDTAYRGFENGLNGNFSKNGFKLIFTNSYLNANSLGVKSSFFRPNADFSYTIKKWKGWKAGTAYNHEINIFRNPNSDTLSAQSYIWQNYRVYIESPDSSKNKYSFEFITRYQQRPDSGTNHFGKPYYKAQTFNFNGKLLTIKNQSLTYTLTYRHAFDADSVGVNSLPENFYLGRITYSITALKGAIKSTTLYELGTGRQQKDQIVYEVSPTNQGNYIWVDFNHDGIKQLNEFVLSPYKTDTSYVQVIIPTLQYASVNTNSFNEVLNITPSAVWKNKTGIRKLVAMFSALGSIQVSKKTFASPDKKVYQYFNPFPLANEDTSIVATTVSSRNSLYFNRLDPKYGAQFDYNYSRSRTYLTGGFENHLQESEDVIVRWNIIKAFNTQTTYTYGIKGDQSDFYDNLKYRFNFNDILTDLSYQFQTYLRLDLKYEFSYAVNPNDSVGKQTAEIQKFTLESRYNRLKKSNITASLSYADIRYNDKGYTNTQLQYAMLDGLQNGNNLVWTISYSQTLMNNLQLTLTYDGRLTGFEPGVKSTLMPVNTARAELRALF